MGAKAQTAVLGAARFGETPRTADDVSDNKDAGGNYSHRAEQYSATEKAEIECKRLYMEALHTIFLFQNYY